jgi:hypothetical protein
MFCMRLTIFFCLIPALVMAQDFFEASGSTAVFTLKAGAKAPPVAIKAAQVTSKQKTLHITFSGTVLRVNPLVSGTLRLYSLNGRMLEKHAIDSYGIVNFKRPLKNGIYLIRIESEGVQLKTTKLIVDSARRQR